MLYYLIKNINESFVCLHGKKKKKKKKKELEDLVSVIVVNIFFSFEISFEHDKKNDTGINSAITCLIMMLGLLMIKSITMLL